MRHSRYILVFSIDSAHSRTGAKRSLTAQLNQPNTADDSESDNAVDAATSSGAAKKRRTAKATSVKDNAASRSRYVL